MSTGSESEVSEASSPDIGEIEAQSHGLSLHSMSESESTASDGDMPLPDEDNFAMSFVPRRDGEHDHAVDNDIRAAIARLAHQEAEQPNSPYTMKLYSQHEQSGKRLNHADETIPEEHEGPSSLKARLTSLSPFGKKKKAQAGKAKGLGTIFGVIVPTCQNILGVILFLRLSWITGEAGLLGTLGIIAVCTLSTILTAISVSAVSTNGPIKGGGTYGLISRSLGPEMGAAIGILFYMALTAECAMYIIGAAELVQSMFEFIPQGALGVRILSPIFLVGVLAVVFGGMKFISLMAPIFFLVTLVSIGGIYVGLLSLPRDLNRGMYPGLISTQPLDAIKSNLMPAAAFGAVSELFSVFYPSVTGIMAGPNRAASLKAPGKAIPLGTTSAIGLTTFIYVSIVVLFCFTIDNDTLRNTYQMIDGKRFFPVSEVSWPTRYIVDAGIFSSTIGAALQTATGAPRLLQAIASDNVLPILKPLRHRVLGNPVPATVFTAVLVFFILMMGELNAITPITTMCFIMCYLSVNFSCALQGMIRSPSFRPKFKFWSWKVSMFAVFLCIIIMFLISWYYALIAIGLSVGIYKYVQWTGAKQNWGDGIRGWRMQQVRSGLHSLDEIAKDVHPNNWRPQLLVLLTLATPERVLTHYKNIDALAAFGRHTVMAGLAKRAPAGGDPNKTIHTAQEAALPEFNREREDLCCECDEDCPPLVPLHPGLLSLAAQLRKSKGLTVVGAVVEGYPRETLAVRRAVKHHIERIMMPSKLKAFVSVISYHTSDRSECELLGAANLVESSGLGEMRPNCVLAHWPDEWRNPASSKSAYKFFRFISTCEAEKMAVILARNLTDSPAPKDRASGTIDIFWFLHDGGLLLLLPYLLKKHKTWRHCGMRLFTVAEPGDDTARLQKKIEDLLASARIEVESITVLELDAEVKEYAYQRTVLLDQRRELLMQLNGSFDADMLVDEISHHRETPKEPDHDRVLIIDNAMKINQMIKARQEEHKVALTILNMPPLRALNERNAMDEMGYLDILTEDIGPTLLIKGSGSEVISGYE
ncbi:Amino acid permease [Carpediemonas membranifera]|uniref:Amino acid permease n=1 Tax=Carpediemonas membranifera TaxID=201153 RepID=A0A8J6DZY6_9EUKA|nr:Amino acid permease [Carpediemonas membranifera]|eukprot:KAG9394299.1 Amino acid permease [Carpediemonas membranifera]